MKKKGVSASKWAWGVPGSATTILIPIFSCIATCSSLKATLPRHDFCSHQLWIQLSVRPSFHPCILSPPALPSPNHPPLPAIEQVSFPLPPPSLLLTDWELGTVLCFSPQPSTPSCSALFCFSHPSVVCCFGLLCSLNALLAGSRLKLNTLV